MKLPNFLHAGDFNALRLIMEAPLSSSYITNPIYVPIELPELSERLKHEGIDITLDEIKTRSDWTLEYKGQRVILYIRDVTNYGERNILPKYHLTFCKTLDRMRRNDRWMRYVVANRDDGNFSINFPGDQRRSVISKLDVCQNCLDKISWQGFHSALSGDDRLRRVGNFQLSEFFKKYPRDLFLVKPKHNSDTAPLNDYPNNWGDISEKFKKKNEYQCLKCRIRLTGLNSRFLHVHHKNGLKNECDESNLEALCIRCHANDQMHSHMKSLPEYKEFLERFIKD